MIGLELEGGVRVTEVLHDGVSRARAAFTPGRSRALAPLLEFLERAA